MWDEYRNKIKDPDAMTEPLGPPVHVSPLIRAVRWGLLVAGIVYGMGKQRLYSAMESHYRAEEAKKKVIRDKELAELKKKIAAEEAKNVKLFEQGKLF